MCQQCMWMNDRDWQEKLKVTRVERPPCHLVDRLKNFRHELGPFQRLWALLVMILTLAFILLFQNNLSRQSLSLLSWAAEDVPKTLQRFVEPEPDYHCPDLNDEKEAPRTIASLR